MSFNEDNHRDIENELTKQIRIIEKRAANPIFWQWSGDSLRTQV